MKYTLCLLTLILLFFMCPGHLRCEPVSAEQHVKEFYQWYIKVDSNFADRESGKDITRYVDFCVANTVLILYRRAYFSSGYYTKSQDTWDEWLDVFVVLKEMKINDTTSVVPISFKFTEDKQHHLVVFVKKKWTAGAS